MRSYLEPFRILKITTGPVTFSASNKAQVTLYLKSVGTGYLVTSTKLSEDGQVATFRFTLNGQGTQHLGLRHVTFQVWNLKQKWQKMPSWNSKQPVLNGWKWWNNHFLCNHLESSNLKIFKKQKNWLFGVPGWRFPSHFPAHLPRHFQGCPSFCYGKLQSSWFRCGSVFLHRSCQSQLWQRVWQRKPISRWLCGSLDDLHVLGLRMPHVRSGLNSHGFNMVGDGKINPIIGFYIPIIRIPY